MSSKPGFETAYHFLGATPYLKEKRNPAEPFALCDLVI